MGLITKAKNLLTGTKRHLHHDGVRGVQWPVWMVYNELAIRGTNRSFGYQGGNIYNYDWDLLILLDGCRVDLLSEKRDHDIISQAEWGTEFSIAPNSSRFLENTFVDRYGDEISETAYITANPHSEINITRPEPDYLDEVWRYAWDEEIGTTPAHAVTDRAIEAGRETDHDRYIVHYIQPHFPSVPRPDLGSGIELDQIGKSWNNSIWDSLLMGEVELEELWSAYQENLEYVLDDVSTLLSNFESEQVVISADHGNAAGERSFYGHGDYPVREVWEVPWLRTRASDTKSHTPKNYQKGENDDAGDLDERLSALGYK